MGYTCACGQTEATLAHYAEYQGNTQSCGEFSVAAAMSLLKGELHWLPGSEVATVADSWTLLDSLRTMGLLGVLAGRTLRMWKGGPTTPWQVANLAQRMAQKRGVQVQASVQLGHAGMRDELINWLNRSKTALVVSIAWDDQTHAQLIDPGGHPIPLTDTPAWKIMDVTLKYTGHVMVLAAHDDDQKRWGFINSWVDGASVDHLYWMSEEDFEETWGYARSPLFIPRLWVPITWLSAA